MQVVGNRQHSHTSSCRSRSPACLELAVYALHFMQRAVSAGRAQLAAPHAFVDVVQLVCNLRYMHCTSCKGLAVLHVQVYYLQYSHITSFKGLAVQHVHVCNSQLCMHHGLRELPAWTTSTFNETCAMQLLC